MRPDIPSAGRRLLPAPLAGVAAVETRECRPAEVEAAVSMALSRSAWVTMSSPSR